MIAETLGLKAADRRRRAAGRWLETWLRVPEEAPSSASLLLPGCDLVSYGGNGRPVLIVPAAIKRAYIWDLFPGASAVRSLLEAGFSVYLLRWTEDAVEAGAGLKFFTADAPAKAFSRIPAQPVLFGHSLGGFFAAMTACLFPDAIRGLVLIESPLVFKGQRLGAAAEAGPLLQQLLNRELTGSALSALGVAIMPDEFLWRLRLDGAASLGDWRRMRLHLGVLRWAFDEFPLPSALVNELLPALAEDAFFAGTLLASGQRIGPSSLQAPALGVCCGSAVAPPATLAPFFERCGKAHTRIIRFPSEAGTALAHVSALVGPLAHAKLWPEIAAWAHADAKA